MGMPVPSNAEGVYVIKTIPKLVLAKASTALEAATLRIESPPASEKSIRLKLADNYTAYD